MNLKLNVALNPLAFFYYYCDGRISGSLDGARGKQIFYVFDNFILCLFWLSACDDQINFVTRLYSAKKK